MIINIFALIVLLFSAIIHEVSHGLVANHYGDPTAKNAGRLTLNPLPHLDPVGSVIVPLLLFTFTKIFGGGIIFGWAKPVPINPYNLKNPKHDIGLIGLAGPASNIVVAILFGIFHRLILAQNLIGLAGLLPFIQIIVFVNMILAIFNLLPVPPLDGSNILFSFLPPRYRGVEHFLRSNYLFLMFILLFFGFRYLVPIVIWLSSLLLGVMI